MGVQSWNYRVVFHDTDGDANCHWWGIHKTYYGRDGSIEGWSEEPTAVIAAPDEMSREGECSARQVMARMLARMSIALKREAIVESDELAKVGSE